MPIPIFSNRGIFFFSLFSMFGMIFIQMRMEVVPQATLVEYNNRMNSIVVENPYPCIINAKIFKNLHI